MKTEILYTISITITLIIAGYTTFATALGSYITRMSRNRLLNVIAYILLSCMIAVSIYFIVKLNNISKMLLCSAIGLIIALGITVLAKTIQDKISTRTETDEDFKKLYSNIENEKKKRKTHKIQQINESTWKITKK